MAASSTTRVGPSVVIPQPATNWGELSSPLETTAKKASRHFGQFLVVLGVCAGVGRQLAAARMTASPDTIIRTCATLQVVMLISLVAGAVLWFFNRFTQDPHLLLCQRREVQNQIEKTVLADLRTKYKNPFVLSDAELNQWIRYLARSDPFDDFMANQTESIFTLPLEDETIKLFRGLYQLYLNDRTPPFKSFIAQKPLEVLFSVQERAGLTDSFANNIAWRHRSGVSNAASYRTFIEAQGVSILSHLNDANLQALVQGFCDAVMESGVGILDLKKNRAVELKAFGPNIETWLFKQVANREGLQPYETFRARNGDEAIGYITNPTVKEDLFRRFSDFVVGRKDGLVKTRKDFEKTIVVFGKDAAERIDILVLTNEIDALFRGDFTYLVFRQRNGIGAIHFTTFGNSNLIQLLKPYFLKLPASDLIGPDYAVDRKLFEITIEDIRSELSGRWNGMTVAEILRTDCKGFVAAVAGPHWCFPNLRTWTEKAVQETAAMSIKDILLTYRVLFETGMLTAGDGNFKSRLVAEIVPITEWTALIDTYDAFVFEKGLLDSTQVEHLVSNFIRTYAESYLNDSFQEAILKYAQVIQNFCMKHGMAQEIKRAKTAVAAEKQAYANWLKGHEVEFEKIIQARQKAAERDIAQFQSDHQITKKEKEKNDAHLEWSKKKAAYEALDKEVKACEKEIDKAKKTYTQKYVALGDLSGKRASIPANTSMSRIQAEEAVRRAQHKVQQAVAYLQKHPLYAQLKDLQTKEGELQSTLQKIANMEQEQNKLSGEVNNPTFAKRKKELEEKIAHPDKHVKGLQAAQEAKEEAKEAPKRLAEMIAKESSLGEVTRRLEQTRRLEKTSPQDIRTRLSTVQSEKAGIETTLADVEAQAQLSQLRAEEGRALEAVRQLRALEGEFQSLSQQIDRHSLDIDELRRQIDQKTRALGKKTYRCDESQEQLRVAAAKNKAAETAYDISAQRLAERTTEIRQACSAEIDSMDRKKAQELLKAQSTNAKTLRDIVSNFTRSI